VALPQLSCSGGTGLIRVYYPLFSLYSLRLPLNTEFGLDTTSSYLFFAGV